MMDLERFEELWPLRDQQDGRTRDELDRQVREDAHCKAFVDGGDWVREMLQGMDPELAPNDFAYRMRLYAANNPGTEPPREQRSWLRWPVVTVGAAAGVAAMFMAFGPLVQQDGLTPVEAGMATAPGESRQVTSRQAPAAADVEMLAESTDSTRTDSVKTPVDQPDWNLRTVSSGSNQ